MSDDFDIAAWLKDQGTPHFGGSESAWCAKMMAAANEIAALRKRVAELEEIVEEDAWLRSVM